MDSIELSSILDCFGDQNTIKNTKTYTIWLEMIAKVLNMLIELKGNNYYSKVFKRANYKLQNNTFWVVITCVLGTLCLGPFEYVILYIYSHLLLVYWLKNDLYDLCDNWCFCILLIIFARLFRYQIC